jgi:hypothetical protein
VATRNMNQGHYKFIIYANESEKTYVEISFYKWELAHGDVHRGIHRRIRIRSPSIVKNGQVVEIGKVPTRGIGERSNP